MVELDDKYFPSNISSPLNLQLVVFGGALVVGFTLERAWALKVLSLDSNTEQSSSTRPAS